MRMASAEYDIKSERNMGNQDPVRASSDLSYLVILVFLSLGIGLCLIYTTVLIAEDGVDYIESARNFSHRPAEEIRSKRPFGYPFLIFLAHKTIKSFGLNDSVSHWIYTAQGVTLLCRTLSLIPLYWIGKILVGPRRSFWALLILILLPYPAEFGSDVLRDWPHLLFLTSGMAFLIYAAGKNSGGLFAAAGLTAGFGYMVRPECAQIVLYGLLWQFWGLFIPRPDRGRLKSLGWIALLLIGFAIPWVPYVKIREGALPAKLRLLISEYPMTPSPETMDHRAEDTRTASAGFCFPGAWPRAFGKLAWQISGNLNYYFVLPWMAGLFCRFRKIGKKKSAETFFIPALMALYSVMLILLDTQYHYLSKRHCLPLVVFTVFYIPVGMQWIIYGLNRRHVFGRTAGSAIRSRWFLILMGAGIAFCIGKFARLVPLRADKQGYREAAAWLKAHTGPDDLIVFPVPIPRIGFYAERSMADTRLRTSMISAGGLKEGQWHHLAGTFDGRDQRLYIDGRLAAEKRPNLRGLGAGYNTFAIGKPSARSDLFYKGEIDRVSLYNKALSPEDIEHLFHGRKISDQARSSQIGFWSFASGGSAVTCGEAVPGMNFDGDKDFIDLSGITTGLTIDELTISVIIKPVFGERMNWVTGNGGQFGLGVRDSKGIFRICEPQPGSILPAEADYVVVSMQGPAHEAGALFNKSVETVYAVWLNPKERKEKIIIYKVVP